MQALSLFSRRAILGKSNKSTVFLEKIAKENSLNSTGTGNFNNYGRKMVLTFPNVVTSSWITSCSMSRSQITS